MQYLTQSFKFCLNENLIRDHITSLNNVIFSIVYIPFLNSNTSHNDDTPKIEYKGFQTPYTHDFPSSQSFSLFRLHL